MNYSLLQIIRAFIFSDMKEINSIYIVKLSEALKFYGFFEIIVW